MPETPPALKRSEEGELPCPECGAAIPVHPGYSPWCDQCSWNLEPYQASRPKNLLESLYASVGQRASQNLFDQISVAQSLKPTLTLSKVLGFLLATLVHGLALGLALFGGLLLFWGWTGEVFIITAIVGALACLGLAWLARPRWPKLPSDIVPEDAFPTLYRVTRNVCEELGTKVDGIVLGEWFSAAFVRAGWRRKRILHLGLPLFWILDGSEKVALLGHEFAHDVIGDPTRNFYIGAAIHSLDDWYGVLRPAEIWPRGSGLSDLMAIPLRLVLLGLAELCRLIAFALIHLLWHDSQRAEYLADLLAASVSGSKATLSWIEKSHLKNEFLVAVRSVSLNPDMQNVFDEFKRRVAEMPKRETERIRRVELLQGSRLDATHPPTAYRVELLKARQVTTPKVAIPPADVEKVEQELVSVQERVQRRIQDAYRATLYA